MTIKRPFMQRNEPKKRKLSDAQDQQVDEQVADSSTTDWCSYKTMLDLFSVQGSEPPAPDSSVPLDAEVLTESESPLTENHAEENLHTIEEWDNRLVFYQGPNTIQVFLLKSLSERLKSIFTAFLSEMINSHQPQPSYILPVPVLQIDKDHANQGLDSVRNYKGENTKGPVNNKTIGDGNREILQYLPSAFNMVQTNSKLEFHDNKKFNQILMRLVGSRNGNSTFKSGVLNLDSIVTYSSGEDDNKAMRQYKELFTLIDAAEEITQALNTILASESSRKDRSNREKMNRNDFIIFPEESASPTYIRIVYPQDRLNSVKELVQKTWQTFSKQFPEQNNHHQEDTNEVAQPAFPPQVQDMPENAQSAIPSIYNENVIRDACYASPPKEIDNEEALEEYLDHLLS